MTSSLDLAGTLAALGRAPDPLDALIRALPRLRAHLARGGPTWVALAELARSLVEPHFGPAGAPGSHPFGPFGQLSFPYRRMGAVDTVNLFDLDELIIFSFYWANRGLYGRVADVGANLGLHSIVLARCGFEVRDFEPDPEHFQLLEENLRRNECAGQVRPSRCAISDRADQREFVRVLGNTTGSHLSGAKPSPYGPLERFPVEVLPIAPLLEWADLLKIDAEGEEARILCATAPEAWRGTDALVEVGSAENADAIWRHFQGTGVRLFAQKLGWQQVESGAGVPVNYKEGTLFLTCRPAMPWGDAS